MKPYRVGIKKNKPDNLKPTPDSYSSIHSQFLRIKLLNSKRLFFNFNMNIWCFFFALFLFSSVTRISVLPLDFDADVLFLVDSSSDVSQENYNREKNFVKSLAFILNLKPGKTRAAVVIYGNFARTVIRFTDFASLSSFFRRIDTLPFLRGRRRLNSALIEGGSVLDTARPSADKVAILLTAGRHTQEVGAPPLNQAVESIRSHNAKLFVVAIGQRVDETELRPLTREPIVVSGFNVLIRNSIRIAKDIKNITGMLAFSPIVKLLDLTHPNFHG